MRDKNCFVIAEAGVNHNGSIQTALDLVSAARDCGADAVKFQTFRAEGLVTKSARKAGYQVAAVPGENSQYGMLKSLELGYKDFEKVQSHCKKCGIEFLSSPFDIEAANMLESLGMRVFKIPSGEVTNLPFLRHIASKKKDIILSTGMCTLSDVENALLVLANAGAEVISILHCVTEYPAPVEQINLNAMLTLGHAFKRPIGYSDHTTGIEIPIAAVAMGATIIEKHFTLDTDMRGPDHSASLNPDDFSRMIAAIRVTEQALGDGIKRPAACEIPNMEVARKSIVSARQLPAGRILASTDLAVKRPGSGISPMQWDALIGATLQRPMDEDQLIDWKDIA